MEIRPDLSRSARDHANSLHEIERLWGAKAGTRAGYRLDVLLTRVEAYEREDFPIASPDPLEAIRFRLDQRGLDYITGADWESPAAARVSTKSSAAIGGSRC